MTNSNLNVLGISGSLRAASFSTALLHEIAGMGGAKANITLFSLQRVPLYNQDLEPSPGNAPDSVVELRRAIAEADGLIVVSPEYNYGISGVLKNALDWASRPAYASVLLAKPVLIITNSPGALGGVRAYQQVRQTLSGTLSRIVVRPEIVIADVKNRLVDGRLTHEPTREILSQGISDLVADILRSR